MTNREVIEKVIDGFNKSDSEAILEHMADDMQWHVLADNMVIDKEGMRKLFTDHPMEIARITENNFIFDGNAASVNGDVVCRDPKSGKEYNMHYCDIYDLENGKVKKMTTYSIEIKK